MYGEKSEGVRKREWREAERAKRWKKGEEEGKG
jgi:hypothetical protein